MTTIIPPQTEPTPSTGEDTPSSPRHSPFEDFFLGHSRVPGRECGDCVECCKLLAIDQPNLKKAKDVLCEHNTGRGCGIYNDRPKVCRAWYCVWHRIDVLPEETRPDRLGVMFELCTPLAPETMLTTRYIRGFSTGGPENFGTPQVQHVLAMFRQVPMPVWLDHDGEMICVHPTAEIHEILLLGKTPANETERAEAELWRSIYEPVWTQTNKGEQEGE